MYVYLHIRKKIKQFLYNNTKIKHTHTYIDSVNKYLLGEINSWCRGVRKPVPQQPPLHPVQVAVVPHGIERLPLLGVCGLGVESGLSAATHHAHAAHHLRRVHLMYVCMYVCADIYRYNIYRGI